MGIILKQTIKGSIYAYLGIGLGFISTALLMPKFLNESEVGLFRLLVSIMTIFSYIANLGFSGAGAKLFPYFRNQNKKHNGFLFWSIITSSIGLLITLGAFAINYTRVLEFLNVKASPLLKDYLYLVYPLTISAVFFSIFDNYSRMLYDSTTGTFLREFLQRVFLFLAIVFLFFDFYNFNNFILFATISLCLPTLIFIYKVWKGNTLFLTPVKGIWTNKIRREFITLSVFTFLSGFSSQIVNYLDQIQVTSIIDLNANGVYATMMMFGTVIYTPTIQVARIGGPVIAESWKIGDLNTILAIYKKSCLSLLVIGITLFLCIVCNIHNVFTILPNYSSGKWVVIWIGLGKLFDMFCGLNGQILQTSKYYYFDTIFMLFLIIGTWMLNNWLIPIYGINGSAMATTIVILIFNLFRTFFVWIVFGMFPFDYKNILTILVSLSCLWIVSKIPQVKDFYFFPSFIMDTLIRSLFIIIFMGMYILKMNIFPELNGVLKKIKSKNNI